MNKNIKNIIWSKCIKYLQNTIPMKNFIECICPLQIHIKKDSIIILSPNDFIKEKIEKNYINIIKNIIKNLMTENIKIKIYNGSLIKKKNNHSKKKNKSIIKNNTLEKKNNFFLIEDIKKEIIKYYNIQETDLIKKRTKYIVKAKQIIFYMSKNFTKLSLSEIGNSIGNYTHAYVIYSYKKIKNSLKKKEDLKKEIYEIEKNIKKNGNKNKN